MTTNNIELIQDIEKRLQSAERSKACILSMIEDVKYEIEAVIYKLNKNGVSDTSENEELKKWNDELLVKNERLESRTNLIEYYNFKLEQLILINKYFNKTI